MFKLPLLQPQLTGNNGVEGRTGSLSKYSPFLSTSRSIGEQGGSGGGLGSNVEVKDWESQARDITADVTSSDKYKSLALHAEVKLAEALERCTRVCPTAYTSEGEEKPNKLKTAVCCQLLGEFAELCGPFSAVLRSIKDELVKSIYSPMYVSEKGLLVFDQLPWFTVAERLEREKEVMAEERAKFEAMLEEQQSMIMRIEEQMGAYQRATNAAQMDAAAVRSKLEGLVASEEAARLEAKTGREELKRLRKEWLKMRDDLDAEKSSAARAKESADSEIASLKSQVRSLSAALATAQAEAAHASAEAAARLPADAIVDMQANLTQLEGELQDCKSKLKVLEDAKAELETRMGTMTPRPSWSTAHKFGIQEGNGMRTQVLVDTAAAKLAEWAARREIELAHARWMEALAAPEPMPREVALSVTTDASAYFITEEGGSSASSQLAAEGLGTGPHVPRCLRWPAKQMVTGLEVLSVAQTEALALDILRAKHVHDSAHTPEHLQTYLYTYFSQRAAPGAQQQQQQRGAHGGQPGGPAGAAPRGATPPGAKPSTPLKQGGPAGPPPPGALHSAVARKAYSLYNAVSSFARKSPFVALFWQVLSGHLPEAAAVDFRLQLSALLQVARAVAAPGHDSHAEAAAIVGLSGGDSSILLGSPTASAVAAAAAELSASAAGPHHHRAQSALVVPTSVLSEALDRLLPSRPGYKISKLKGALAQGMHPAAMHLAQVEALLQPLAFGAEPGQVGDLLVVEASTAAAAQGVEEAGALGEASPAPTARSRPGGQTTGGGAGGAGAGAGAGPGSAAPVVPGPAPDVSHIMENPFVATFLEQHLEEVAEAAEEVARKVAHLPASPAGAALLQQHQQRLQQQASAAHSQGLNRRASHSGRAGPSPWPAEITESLGSLVDAAGVLEVLRAAGLTPENAARAVASCISGPGGACGSAMDAWSLLNLPGAGGLHAWSGLVAAKLQAEWLLKPSGQHDLPGMLAWAKEKHMAAA